MSAGVGSFHFEHEPFSLAVPAIVAQMLGTLAMVVLAIAWATTSALCVPAIALAGTLMAGGYGLAAMDALRRDASCGS